ncbi:hypothetical protein EG329_011426 [Mollisiaceae sp. DMI_Dod_QoI]|nr:hypothetical protein EG329_011426 [Helotiales sp. DMI_Dod_QoI]
MDRAEQDHYQVLGLKNNATSSDIKAAFRKAALTKHPDKNGGASGEAFIKIAYDILSNENSRADYDRKIRLQNAQWYQGFAPQRPKPNPQNPFFYPDHQSARSYHEARTREAEARAQRVAEDARAREAAERRREQELWKMREKQAEEKSRMAAERAQKAHDQAARERMARATKKEFLAREADEKERFESEAKRGRFDNERREKESRTKERMDRERSSCYSCIQHEATIVTLKQEIERQALGLKEMKTKYEALLRFLPGTYSAPNPEVESEADDEGSSHSTWSTLSSVHPERFAKQPETTETKTAARDHEASPPEPIKERKKHGGVCSPFCTKCAMEARNQSAPPPAETKQDHWTPLCGRCAPDAQDQHAPPPKQNKENKKGGSLFAPYCGRCGTNVNHGSSSEDCDEEEL